MNEGRIKVLYIHHHGTAGGASSSLRYLIKNFPPNTVDAYILSPPGTAIDIFKTVTQNVIVIPELPEVLSVAGGNFFYIRLVKLVMNLSALNIVKRHVRQIDPDLIHLNELSLGLVAKTCKQMGYRVVMHARCVLSERVPLLNSIIQKLIRKNVDQLIAIDGSVAGKLHKAGSVEIVYNPLHIDSTFQPEIRVAREKCTCLFLANLITYKGLFDLLEAAILLKDQANISILIAGSNSRPSAFFKTIKGRILKSLGLVSDNESKLQQIISKHQLTAVSYIGHVKNINEWLQRTDVLLFPSHMNGPSRSVFEAGALGIPSILALKDKIEDVVIDRKNGIIIEEKSPKQLAAAIKAIASDVEFRSELGANARKHFNQLNNPKQSASRVLDIYRKLV